MSSHDSDDPADLARRHWNELNTERTKQRMSVAKLSRQLGEPESTLYFGFNERKSLPDKAVFLAIATALKLDNTQWAMRWDEWDHARTYRPSPAQYSVEVSTRDPVVDKTKSQLLVTDGEGGDRRRRLVKRYLWIMSPLALLALIPVLLHLFSRDAGTGVRTPEARSPDVTKSALDYRAHVDFYRTESVFNLFDDQEDGRSAVFQYNLNHGPIITVWNTKGAGDKKETKIIDLDVSEGVIIEYRVCTGQFSKLIYEEECSQWTTETISSGT